MIIKLKNNEKIKVIVGIIMYVALLLVLIIFSLNYDKNFDAIVNAIKEIKTKTHLFLEFIFLKKLYN